jgi:eukaryotic-like serine/threonine-protein kinase
LHPGDQLDGRYRILRKLGQGGEGEIFIARDEERRCKVAVKSQFPRTFESTDTYTAAASPLEDELGRLNFMQNVPGIPQVLDNGHYGRYRGRYIVMELIEGDTLQEWIFNHHPVPLSAAVSAIAQLCEILKGVHHEGYVHRDVTPKNTMLQRDGRIRLLDVGISGVAGSPNDELRGTPGYAPPEQYDSQAPITPQVDVFSVGVLLFAMVATRLPYVHLEGPPEAMSPALRAAFRAELPEEVRDLALAMVSIDPQSRPDGVAEVLQRLPPRPAFGSPPSPKATCPDPTLPYRLGLLPL